MSGSGYGDPAGPGGSIVRRGVDRVRAVHALGATSNTALFTGGGIVMGISIRETSGSAATTVRFYDGNTTGGVQLMSVSVPSGTFEYIGFWDYGLDIQAGLYIQVTAGSADVFAHYRPDALGMPAGTP